MYALAVIANDDAVFLDIHPIIAHGAASVCFPFRFVGVVGVGGLVEGRVGLPAVAAIADVIILTKFAVLDVGDHFSLSFINSRAPANRQMLTPSATRHGRGRNTAAASPSNNPTGKAM